MFRSTKVLASWNSCSWGLSSNEKPPRPHSASHRDRSIVFRETLLDALQKNQFSFQESDILPLFLKYQRNRQLLIDLVSFLTYVLRSPTQIYLRRLRNSQFVPKDLGDRAIWFKATKIDSPET